MSRHFSAAVLDQVRAVPLTSVLEGLGYHIAIDRDFVPTKDARSQRWLVDSARGATELLVTGPKWFDTRVSRGGGGAIDLVMHLERLSFVSAVKRIAGGLNA